MHLCGTFHKTEQTGGAQKEQRRRHAEKRSSKTRKWTAKVPPLILRSSDVLRAKLKGAEKNKDSPNDHFPARRLLPVVRSDKLRFSNSAER